MSENSAIKSEGFQLGSMEWATAIREETKSLVRTIDIDYLRLAEKLWLIFDTPMGGDRKNNPWWSKWGYGHIAEFEEKELGLHRRKAERLRRIWGIVGVDLAGLDKDLHKRLMAIGYSKMLELTRDGVLNLENSKYWIERAEQIGCSELSEEVKNHLLGRTGIQKGTLGNVEPLDHTGEIAEEDVVVKPFQTTVAQVAEQTATEIVYSEAGKTLPGSNRPFTKVFALFQDQMDSVKAALERASELSGSKKDGQNLSLICLDFLATNEFFKASLEQTQRFFARIEKALNVKIIVLSKEDHEILYGYKVLDKIIGNEQENSESSEATEQKVVNG